MGRLENVPLEGELNCWARGFDMPDVLLKVCETGKTGLLRFASAEAEKTLFVREGEIIFAKSTSLDDRLGEYLLRNGKISIPDLMRVATEVRPGRRLGTVLIENNILEAKELVQAVVGQVRAIILSLFRWTEAWYGFNEEDLPNETITLNMPTTRLIIDGIQLIDSWRRIAQGVGELSSVYRRVPGNEGGLRTLRLDGGTLEVLELLSDPLSVEQVCISSPLPDLDVCRHLWIFRCLGWIEQIDGAEAVSSAVTGNHGVERIEESGDEPTAPVREEPDGARLESTDGTADVSPSPALAVPTVSDSVPSGDEAEIRFDVEEEDDSPAAAPLADLRESRVGTLEGGTGEIEESPTPHLEAEHLAPTPLATQEPAAPNKEAANADGTVVVEGEATEAAAQEVPVVEGITIPPEPIPTEDGAVPVIEGAVESPGTTPMETGVASVIDGAVEAVKDEDTQEGDEAVEKGKVPVMASEDMDLEGLGMVLGEEEGES
jgi:hypothetical protein